MFFSEADRLIYKCPVTEKALDPLALKRAITVASKNRFNAIVQEARSTDELVRATAEGQLVAVGRAAFGLAPIDPKSGAGVLDTVVLEAVTAFTRWLSKKGPTAQSGPDSAPCTACP